MLGYRLKRTALACLAAACVLAGFVPAHATDAHATGTVKLAWFGPGGEDVNTATGQPGTLGYSINIPSTWVGKHFDLTYPGANDVLLEQSGFKVYAVDLDVYFYNPDGWPQPDGTVRHWDNTTGVEPGPESATIPAGTNRAFVTINITTTPFAHDVSFDFAVTLS
jgi:hypothetical protein